MVTLDSVQLAKDFFRSQIRFRIQSTQIQVLRVNYRFCIHSSRFQ